MSNEARLRFAPSPTGQVHIGNIRTAIFNYLYARHTGGKFLVRVEDTDRERSTPEAIAALFEVMEWLGLDYDEDPLYQSSQAESHLAAAQKLMDEGQAYKFAKGEGGEAVLFRIPWNARELPFVREAGNQSLDLHKEHTVKISFTGLDFATRSKKGKATPTEACLAGFRDLKIVDGEGATLFELEPNIDAVLGGESFEIEGGRKMYFTRHEVTFTDLVKGELSKPLDSMKDQVIVRSNGTPVFHLANVCDDSLQAITHIVRGDDHVENTYRHILLFNALGKKAPQYAHLPMIVNKQGKPFSKRDGDAFVGDFRTKGFQADALFNYLTLLGWSPGDDREKMTRDEMVEAFTLDRVRSAASQMDMMKLQNMNGMYLAEMPKEAFAARALEILRDQDWFDAANTEYFDKIVDLMQSRAKLFTDVLGWKSFYSSEFVLPGKPARKNLNQPGVKETFELLISKFEDAQFSPGALDQAIYQTTEEKGLNPGKFNLPIRLAVTGTNAGADLFQTMVLIGRDEVLKRLRYAAENYCEVTTE